MNNRQRLKRRNAISFHRVNTARVSFLNLQALINGLGTVQIAFKAIAESSAKVEAQFRAFSAFCRENDIVDWPDLKR